MISPIINLNGSKFQPVTQWKGIKTMDSKRTLNKYIHELIVSYGKFTGDTYQLSMTSLHDDEQGELTRLYMEANDCDPMDSLADYNFYLKVMKMLESDTPDTREDLAKMIKQNIVRSYSESIQIIIDDYCNDYLHETYNAKGLYAKRNSSGDLYWSAY